MLSTLMQTPKGESALIHYQPQYCKKVDWLIRFKYMEDTRMLSQKCIHILLEFIGMNI